MVECQFVRLHKACRRNSCSIRYSGWSILHSDIPGEIALGKISIEGRSDNEKNLYLYCESSTYGHILCSDYIHYKVQDSHNRISLNGKHNPDVQCVHSVQSTSTANMRILFSANLTS